MCLQTSPFSVENDPHFWTLMHTISGILHCPSKVVYTFLRRAIEIEIEIGIAIVIEMK